MAKRKVKPTPDVAWNVEILITGWAEITVDAPDAETAQRRAEDEVSLRDMIEWSAEAQGAEEDNP